MRVQLELVAARRQLAAYEVEHDPGLLDEVLGTGYLEAARVRGPEPCGAFIQLGRLLDGLDRSGLLWSKPAPALGVRKWITAA
jgi:hypothetical protein